MALVYSRLGKTNSGRNSDRRIKAGGTEQMPGAWNKCERGSQL
jgi:hypothetical protein